MPLAIEFRPAKDGGGGEKDGVYLGSWPLGKQSGGQAGAPRRKGMPAFRSGIGSCKRVARNSQVKGVDQSCPTNKPGIKSRSDVSKTRTKTSHRRAPKRKQQPWCKFPSPVEMGKRAGDRKTFGGGGHPPRARSGITGR